MYILFDIGGTKMRIACSKDLKSFEEPKKMETPKNFEEGIKLFVQTVKELSKGKKIKGVAGGITGTLDKEKAVLLRTPLKDWIGKPLKKEIEKAIGASVFIENDSAIVGLGEALSGSGKGFKIVTYITVSTGVGGARIIDGKIDEKNMSFEPGHQIIELSLEKRPEYNQLGDLEGFVSGTAMERRYGVKPYEIKDDRLWEELAEKLAVGVHNTILHWVPDVVVLGGSMMVGTPKIETERVAFYLSKILKVFPEMPVVKEASLKDIGGLYGAMGYLKQNLSKSKWWW